MTDLSPAQTAAFDELIKALPIGNIFVVWSHTGMGKTTILKELHGLKGGKFLTMTDYIQQLSTQDPLKMEETLESILMDAFSSHELVILDDLHLIYDVICGCGYGSAYPRGKYVEAILTSIAGRIIESGKKLILSFEGSIPAPIRSRCYISSIQKFKAADYSTICSNILEEKAASLDFQKIHRFAPKLNAHQLNTSALWLKQEDLDTDRFIEYLRSRRMGSNVDLEEVEAIDLYSLRGIDDVIQSLEANIIVPLERDDLATEYGISPKRGVLLAGPPGTGKTTVGRALAHRLRSKFFLIDGTFISGSRDFYQKVQHVFETAKHNAPSIIFIDDSDVIFENKEDFGLYRYLLTMLDGLESESNKRVCIMMTTMDVASVPPALVRSGRIELWLETRLPDNEARLKILIDQAHRLPPELRSYDPLRLAEITDGLTGADLKRLIEDAKILLAYDKSRNVECEDLFSYFERATETIRSNKLKYEAAEERSKQRAPSMKEALEAAFSSMGGYGFDTDNFPD